MIRALRFLWASCVYTAWYGTRVLVSAMVGLGAPAFNASQRGWALAHLRATRIRLVVEGLDRLEPGRPYVFTSSHESWVDIWMILAGLPGTIRFVFKRELSRVPVLGWAIHAMKHVEIDRGNRGSAFASYDRAASAIKEGTSAVVFCEGTRSRQGKLLPFKKGPFVLAIAAQAPVVPIFCDQSFEALPKGSIAPRPGTVFLRIGRPIPTAGLGYQDRDRLADQVRAAMLELGAHE
ncbi:MAG: 1-acyl-sn-glycerol-3-phosphate acyltransferase [Gemmatimonadetes bacterium]|nr:1-acyl-sn-glycerol-3-phosphate acyltransferase [Gemmatimonadota bacterium]